MRLIKFSSILLLIIGCAGTKNTVDKPNKFDGTWIPVQQEFGGASLPSSAFAKQKLIINDSNYTVIAESVDKGVVQYKDDKMDIYGKEGVNAGKHFTAIYKYEKNQLTICYNLSGDSYPQAFETKSGPTLFLSVFKRD
ncbi:MAG TPA: TIGR03067 domain-containing protein [Parafilimonas sp.]|nr:TIGR03067 domain-containing protein [Parafilimonas sp.]